MVRYNAAISYFILSFTTSSSLLQFSSSFTSNNNILISFHPSQNLNSLYRRDSSKHLSSISASASSSNGSNNTNNNNTSNAASAAISLERKVRTMSEDYIDTLSQSAVALLSTSDDDYDDDDSTNSLLSDEEKTSNYKLVQRRKRIILDKSSGRTMFTFGVTLPIQQNAKSSLSISTESSSSSPIIGMTLSQFSKQGILSETLLDLDSLEYFTIEEDMIRNKSRVKSTSNDDDDDGLFGSLQVLEDYDTTSTSTSSTSPTTKRYGNGIGSGLIVTSVIRGGLAWNAGIRCGDVLTATTATMGDKLWPKSTLDGVRSAISSRKVMYSTMEFQFQRSELQRQNESEEVVEEFEINLTRPMGINVEDTKNGYVKITSFTDQASDLVLNKLSVGDRIVAVESSLGNNMWPVSNVDGLVSACTSRVLGQPIRLRFERVLKDTDLIHLKTEDTVDKVDSSSSSLSSGTATMVEEKVIQNSLSLQSRCRDVLKRYLSVYDPTSGKDSAVPALVADRVLDSLADASESLDAVTLSLLMNSYTVCKMYGKALEVFEIATGLSSNGSTTKPQVSFQAKKSGNKIQSSVSSLNIYTITDLIHVHAKLGDFESARRVLAALEGESQIINGISADTWSVNAKADTKCYNTVLAAAANSVERNGLEIAEELFNSMCEPVLFPTARPKKDLVTYNTMIGAYARALRRQDAFKIFSQMKEAGVSPDKFTITSLVKAVVEDGDIQTARILLRDMKKSGMETDVVAYNTVIRALCDKRMLFEAKELIGDMESRGIDPDGRTYGLLMNGLLKANKPGPCLTLFEAACADRRTAAITENVKLYTTAVTAAAALGDYERALDLVSRMSFAGVKPNIKTLTSVMGACIQGNKSQLAIDVFQKIKEPDGIAVSFVIKALCNEGDFKTAIEKMNSLRGIMTGKQMMDNYNYILLQALKMSDYATAQDTMAHLLGNGFIPSNDTFRSILEGLNLTKKRRAVVNSVQRKSQVKKKFEYLLSVLDILDTRKVPCDAYFYSSILYEGSREGSLPRKIASLIAVARSKQLKQDDDQDKQIANEKQKISWVSLLNSYSEYKGILDQVDLPSIRVRISDKVSRQVFLVEQKVTYSARRGRTTWSRSKVASR